MIKMNDYFMDPFGDAINHWLLSIAVKLLSKSMMHPGSALEPLTATARFAVGNGGEAQMSHGTHTHRR